MNFQLIAQLVPSFSVHPRLRGESSFKQSRPPADDLLVSSFPGLKDANDPVDAFE
jgi:hypothetical protein